MPNALPLTNRHESRNGDQLSEPPTVPRRESLTPGNRAPRRTRFPRQASAASLNHTITEGRAVRPLPDPPFGGHVAVREVRGSC